MKHHDYTQNAIQGPYTPTRLTKFDGVLLWLSGFIAGFLLAFFTIGN